MSPHPRPASNAAPRPIAPPDAALVARARAGERDAFEQLAARAMPMLLGTARRLLRDRYAAEEAVAEALFRAWRRLGGFRGEAGFGTWLHRIVCRVAADRFRRQARDRSRHERLAQRTRDEAPAAQRGPLEQLSAREEGRRLRAAVRALPERQRLVIVLHVWEGLSLAEVAETLDMRYATAKSNLCHARKALRQWVAEDSR